ncbi:FG-GAP-like repeat-containing protein [Streptomyces sp. NPDC052396]|uniref:FG-GAP-like repeat-containing protein n=1 Tax=Streptomyces sp. NPDC052396 TaxID=3365689 RepID=UPI0037D51CE8
MSALLGATAMTLLPTAPSAHAVSPAKPALRVMPLGDSITAGSGSATGSSYRLPLWNLVGAQSRYTIRYVGSQASGQLPDLSHEGHSGYMIDGIRAGIDQWMAAARPDAVLLHIGVNDLDRSTDPTHAPERLKTLIDQIFTDRPGVTVIRQGVIPTTQGLQVPPSVYNDQARQLQSAEEQAGNKFRYVEPPELTSAEMANRLHPNDSGYARMGRTFFTALDQAYTDGAVTGAAPLSPASDSGGTGRVRFADFDGDGKADYVTVGSNGAINVWVNKGGDGRGGWQALGQVATGTTTDPSRVRFADFDGDGKADYEVINPDGSMSVWLNKGGDGHGGWQALGKVTTGATTDQSRVKLADFDGDGKADYEVINPDGSMSVWLNRRGDGNGGWQALGKVATGTTTDQNSVQFADFTGSGNAAYIRTNPSTSAADVYAWNGGDGHGGWNSLGQVASDITIN